MTEVIATLLVKIARNPDDYKDWRYGPNSQCHPLAFGNVWRMFCYSEHQILANLEALYGCPGVESVTVVQGEKTWQDCMGSDVTIGRISDEEALGIGKYESGIPVQWSVPGKKRSKNKK